MQITHVTIGTNGRLGPFGDAARRHDAVRRLVHSGARELALFNLLPDHGHFGITHGPGRSADFRRAASLVLRSAGGVPIQKSHFREISEVNHARSLVRYLLTQCAHHDLPYDDALWTGSCFQDLVGARWLGPWTPQLRRLDPRGRVRDALAAVGLPAEHIEPLSLERVYELGVVRLREAAVAALAARPDLQTNTRPDVDARTCIVRLGSEAGFQTADLRRVLRVDRRSLYRIQAREAPAPALRAVRVRLGLEEAVTGARMRQAWRTRRQTGSSRRYSVIDP